MICLSVILRDTYVVTIKTMFSNTLDDCGKQKFRGLKILLDFDTCMQHFDVMLVETLKTF